MDSVVEFVSGYIKFWPAAVFVALCIAGLNIPVSEDLVIIASAGFCRSGNAPLVPTLIAIYAGVVVSDIMVYWEGYAVSKGLLNFKWLKKAMASNKVKVMTKKLETHGAITFITTRFIPLGVRNALFLTSGLLNLKFTKFLRFDMVAALLSNMTLFWVVYAIGSHGSKIVRYFGCSLLVVLVIFVVIALYSIKKEADELDRLQKEKEESENNSI